jgi:outer membrane immunogenic protein
VQIRGLTIQQLLRLAAVGLSFAALAGEVQAQEPRSWSGFYAGIHGGYHWGAGSTSISLQPDLASWLAISPDYGQFQGRYDSSADGFIGGAQLGYNWRSGTLVFGFETDISYLDAEGSETRAAMVSEGGPAFPVVAYSRQEIDWLGTVRGRIGVLPFEDQRLLVYVTGGLAYARVRTGQQIMDVDFASGYAGSSSDWEVGGTVGAGLEWTMGGAWTLKAEYLYYDLGDRRVEGTHVNNAAPPQFGFDAQYDLSGHIARVGLNYRIGAY